MSSYEEDMENGDEILSQPRYVNGLNEVSEQERTGGDLSEANDSETGGSGSSRELDITQAISRAMAPILTELKIL